MLSFQKYNMRHTVIRSPHDVRGPKSVTYKVTKNVHIHQAYITILYIVYHHSLKSVHNTGLNVLLFSCT